MTDNPTDGAQPDYSSLNAADSAAKLVELSAAYKTTQPAPALHELSPEAAGQRLAEMTKKFHESNKPKNTPADAAIVGQQPPQEIETISWPATTVRNKLDLVEWLRDRVQIPDAGLARIVAGSPYSKEDVAWAAEHKRGMLADPDIRALILRGDPKALRHLIGVTQILLAGAEQTP